MLTLTRTTSANADFQVLVALLDQDLARRDGDDHAFYAQLNTLDQPTRAVLAYELGQPVGCGAFREHAPGLVEIKRMFVRPAHRGRGIAQAVLAELERWASETGCRGCVLETGQNQPEAIRLYQKTGYVRIPNYGKYVGVANSVCFEKSLPEHS